MLIEPSIMFRIHHQFLSMDLQEQVKRLPLLIIAINITFHVYY